MSSGFILMNAIRAESKREAEKIIKEAIKTLGFEEYHEKIHGNTTEYYVPLSYSKKWYAFGRKKKIMKEAKESGVLQKIVISNVSSTYPYPEEYTRKLKALQEKVSLIEKNYVLIDTEYIADYFVTHLMYKKTGAKVPAHIFWDDGNLEGLIKFKEKEDKK